MNWNSARAVRSLWERWRRVFGPDDPNVQELGWALRTCPECGLMVKPTDVIELLNIEHCKCEKRKTVRRMEQKTIRRAEPMLSALEHLSHVHEWVDELEATGNNMDGHAQHLRAAGQTDLSEPLQRVAHRVLVLAKELRDQIAERPERLE